MTQLRFLYKKRYPYSTKKIIELQSLLTPEDWSNHKKTLLSINDTWIDVLRILILTGFKIEKAIEIMPKLYKISSDYNINLNITAKIIPRIINQFSIFYK